MVAPTILVLISFYAFFFKGTNRQLTARRAELQQLQQEKPSVDFQISTLQKNLSELNNQIAETKQRNQQVIIETAQAQSNQAKLKGQLTFSNSSAETMDHLMHLLEEHRLAVVGNETVASIPASIDNEREILLARLVLLTQPKNRRSASFNEDEANLPPTNSDTRFVNTGLSTHPSATGEISQPQQLVAIKVQGAFQNIQQLVANITANYPQVTIVGVELEKVDLQRDVRNWTLSLLL